MTVLSINVDPLSLPPVPELIVSVLIVLSVITLDVPILPPVNCPPVPVVIVSVLND